MNLFVLAGGLLLLAAMVRLMNASRPFDRFPVPDPVVVTSRFGPRTLNGVAGFHAGLDLRAAIGTPLVSIGAGVVRTVSRGSRAGLFVEIDGTGPWATFRWSYMHLSEAFVGVGQLVELGDVVAASGDSGSPGQPHLHLELHLQAGGPAFDPLTVLPLGLHTFK